MQELTLPEIFVNIASLYPARIASFFAIILFIFRYLNEIQELYVKHKDKYLESFSFDNIFLIQYWLYNV